MIRDDDSSSSYQSHRGYRMWGGIQHPVGNTSGLGWLSFALVVGVALAIGSWVALRH